MAIAISTFFFLRIGFSVSILLYAYVLVYFNNFFNYTSFLFVLFAVYCTPKIRDKALLFYAIDVFVIFAIKQYAILTLGIHGLNCLLFYLLSTRVFGFVQETTLLLTDDERLVLSELAAGKMQKQIDQFSQNTITKLIKNAQMRNNCKSKTELIHRFMKENPQALEMQSQNDEIESQEAANE
jgi:DNA-binding CsgD family transcriptional regulator